MNNQEMENLNPNETEPARERLPALVYYVTSDNDTTVLVGMEVERKGREISWFDSAKERTMTIETVLDNDPLHFVFKRVLQEGGQTYTFAPMNLDIYTSTVKHELVDGKDFPDEQSMINAFLETKKFA